MIVWSYHILDWGALRDDPFQEAEELSPRVFWVNPQTAVSSAEIEINERLVSVVDDEEDTEDIIVWKKEDNPPPRFPPSKSYTWGDDHREHGFTVVVYPVQIMGIDWDGRER